MIGNKITDLLARLQTSKTKKVSINYNIELLALLRTLESIGILTIKILSKTIIIEIKPNTYTEYVIHSKPSRRIYKSYKEIWTHNGGRGTTILRTSKGFLTIEQARKERQGGELLFTIK